MIPVADIRPKPALARGSGQALVEHSHRRVVGPGHLRTQHERFQSAIEWFEQLRRLPHPSAHRLVRNVDAEARKDFALPMQRQVIGDLADDHLG
jgi:hypothetical protein